MGARRAGDLSTLKASATANRAAVIIASYSALCEVRRRRLSWALQAITTVGCRDVVAGTGA
jgi:hypothetical protein